MDDKNTVMRSMTTVWVMKGWAIESWVIKSMDEGISGGRYRKQESIGIPKTEEIKESSCRRQIKTIKTLFQLSDCVG